MATEVIALTLGDPGGVGLELALKAAAAHGPPPSAPVYAD